MIKDLQEKRGRLYGELKSLNEQMAGKVEDAESRARFDKIADEISAIDAEIRREEVRLSLESTTAAQPKDVNKRASEAVRKVLTNTSLTSEESALVEKRDSISGIAGTNILPTTVSDSIESAIIHIGGFISNAGQVITTAGNPMNFPTANNTAQKGTWVDEYESTTVASPTFTPNTLNAYTLASNIVPISLELIQDSEFDLIAWLQSELTMCLSAGLNEAITKGNGTSRPTGIVGSATAVEGTASITFDNLMDLKAGVNAAYWQNAKFMMNPKTFVSLRKVKGNDGQYVWNNIANAAVPMIDGHEVILNSDLDDIAATGGKAPVLFGDFSKYKLRLVRNISFSVLREVYAAYRAVGVMAFLRADGKLLDAGTHPVAKLVQPA